MKLFFLRISLLFLGFSQAVSVKAQNTLQHAQNLFNQYQLAESHAVYSRISIDPAIADSVKVMAYQQVASQDWKFYNNYFDATQALQAATNLNINLYGTNLLRASISLESKNFKIAELCANKCLQLAKSDLEMINAGILFAKVIKARDFEGIDSGRPLNQQDLKKAMDLINQILEKQPGNPEASEALIGIGILLKDGYEVIKGWKSYYLVSNEQDINQAIKPGFELLRPILINWKGKELPAAAITTLAIGFADSKFFDYANFMANEVKKKDSAIFLHNMPLRDIVSYQDYISGIKKVNEAMYPQVASGRTKYENTYDSLMDMEANRVWNKLSFINKNMKFDPDSLYNILNRKYGMEGYSGTTVNYYGMLMGHIIHKELKQINQYGYSTSFTYISVDRLVSRDFTSWYGTTNVGGWGDSTTIIQVRKAYMTEPFQELNWMTDPAENKIMAAHIAKLRQDDLENCKKDPYAEPKFLSPCLKFNAASKIYERLTASGLRGMELNIAFVNEILRLTVASTVFAHEGRHAIDQLYFPKEFKAMSDDERELRAKFSEVIFSLDPKMAFTGSILGSDLDEQTNHGKANKRFRVIIVNWMKAHQSEIDGLDPNVPLLMQFDLLTDQQLIKICKSADPYAKATSGNQK